MSFIIILWVSMSLFQLHVTCQNFTLSWLGPTKLTQSSDSLSQRAGESLYKFIRNYILLDNILKQLMGI